MEWQPGLPAAGAVVDVEWDDGRLRATGQTGRDGWFRFPPSSVHRISAATAGKRASRQDAARAGVTCGTWYRGVAGPTSEGGGALRVQLSEAARALEVRVNDSAGRPVAGAKVVVEPAPQEGPAERRTRANGSVTFTGLWPTRPYHLRVDPPPGEEFALRLLLPDRPTVTGDAGAVRITMQRLARVRIDLARPSPPKDAGGLLTSIRALDAAGRQVSAHASPTIPEWTTVFLPRDLGPLRIRASVSRGPDEILAGEGSYAPAEGAAVRVVLVPRD